MKVIFISLSLAIAACDPDMHLQDQWKKFKAQYQKKYNTTDEELQRFDIFRQNVQEINDHNARYKKGLVTFTKGINRFGDLTPVEFEDRYQIPHEQNLTRYNWTNIRTSGDGKPEYLDWRENGAVTDIQDQGTCGSCFIFSAIGVLEGYYFRKHKKLISFSEQNVVDCMEHNTCSGGITYFVFKYVAEKGINTATDYPYEGQKLKCRQDNATSVSITFGGIHRVDKNEAALKDAVTNYGPVSICVYASSRWMFYKSGVWYDEECSEKINHAVLLVGYGTENGRDYWLIKNSAGKDWGDNGYIKIARNVHDSYCGITLQSLYIE